MGMLYAKEDDFLRLFRELEVKDLHVEKRVGKTVNKVFEKAI